MVRQLPNCIKKQKRTLSNHYRAPSLQQLACLHTNTQTSLHTNTQTSLHTNTQTSLHTNTQTSFISAINSSLNQLTGKRGYLRQKISAGKSTFRMSFSQRVQ